MAGPTHPRLRALAVALSVALMSLAAAGVFKASLARADDAGTLTVVGTSDVQDSGLVPNLIKPLFEQAYPQFRLRYVSLGTGAAINYAQAGTASALIVHAASLENQFVAQGYSLEHYGRAVFYGDYVLLGPRTDPAGVLAGASHDVTGALERIAAAGAAGRADFVSRANTSGTAVQEHLIWGLATPSATLTLCPVSASNGGGAAPSATSNCPTTPQYPAWYHATGVAQAANVENANACNYPNAASGTVPDCYVLTDRGTFDCLQSSACAGGAAQPSNLQIVTRDNDPSARGGATELINSFHAYAVNPAKFSGSPNVQINTAAARAFLDFITSPALQGRLSGYLTGADGPPFIADASPRLAIAGLPSAVPAGSRISVLGSVANPVPGTPALAGAQVTVSEASGGLGVGLPIASTRAGAIGQFALSFSPPASGLYQVSTAQLERIEDPVLSPPFGDLLSPAATAPVRIDVSAVVGSLASTAAPGGLLVTASLLPRDGHAHGRATLLAARAPALAPALAPAGGSLRRIAFSRVEPGDGAIALGARLPAGRWRVAVTFSDPGTVLEGRSAPVVVAVPSGRPPSVRAAVSVSRGLVTVRGDVRPAGGAGERLELLALDAGPLRGGVGAAERPGLREVAATLPARHRGTFAVRARLARRRHWILAIRVRDRGRAALVTPAGSVDVT